MAPASPNSQPPAPTPLLTYVLRLADTALVLGHRVSEWTYKAPTLEEDIALSNLALDLVGQARLLYDYADRLEGLARGEDYYAFMRTDRDFLNVLLVEQPNGDFAQTIARHLVFSAFAHPFYAALAHCADTTLAGIGAKAEKEMAYHFRHAAEWVIRLGDGTAESHARAQTGLNEAMVYAAELFETDAVERALIAQGIAPDPALLRAQVEQKLQAIAQEATLTLPVIAYPQSGGRNGVHSEYLGPMLAQMQALHRAHPGATW